MKMSNTVITGQMTHNKCKCKGLGLSPNQQDKYFKVVRKTD